MQTFFCSIFSTCDCYFTFFIPNATKPTKSLNHETAKCNSTHHATTCTSSHHATTQPRPRRPLGTRRLLSLSSFYRVGKCWVFYPTKSVLGYGVDLVIQYGSFKNRLKFWEMLQGQGTREQGNKGTREQGIGDRENKKADHFFTVIGFFVTSDYLIFIALISFSR